MTTLNSKLTNLVDALLDVAIEEYRNVNIYDDAQSIDNIISYAENGLNLVITAEQAQKVRKECLARLADN